VRVCECVVAVQNKLKPEMGIQFCKSTVRIDTKQLVNKLMNNDTRRRILEVSS